MVHAMPSQSFTFFFTADAHRATDRSQDTTWSVPKMSSTAPVRLVSYVLPKSA
jgi:hypothetical protein